ncbi:unnamed protein product, partial [Discosporangium mesarthrocarpum]
VWALVGTLVALGMPLGFASAVSSILEPDRSLGIPRLRRAAAILATLYAMEPAATFLFVRGMSKVANRALARLKMEAMRAVLMQEVAFFDMKGFTEVTSAVTTDIREVKAVIQGNLQRDRGIRAVLETVFGMAVLLALSPRLAWIFVLLIPCVAWTLAESRKKLAALARLEADSVGRETAITSEAMRNIRTVKSFGTEAKELSRFQSAVKSSAATATAMGVGAGKLEALNRLAIYF